LEQTPYRLVDASPRGWLISGNPEAPQTYRGDGMPWNQAIPLHEIVAAYGPIRTVGAPTDAELAELVAALSDAGRKAMVSLAAAVEVVFHQARERFGGLAAADSYERAKRSLVAGRHGSWESELLSEVWLTGNGYNLVRKGAPRRHLGVAEAANWKRAAGPSPRVNQDARDRMAAVITAWTQEVESGRYVEVAETLAAVVSRYADETHGPDGWARIADQWQQPDARMPDKETAPLYRLFYSLSAYFDPNAW
jgi:predicted transcriptional regulator